METAKSVPTGCYKCGRPGHWSRDCPDSNPNPNPNPNTNTNIDPKSVNLGNSNSSRSFPFKSRSGNLKAVAVKPKKVQRSRPKLTPDLLLGDDGLGFVLRHFPRNFKFRGHRHEVSDLGNLIHMYSEWHSHLLPYYSFDQFVHKVEQVATTKRVKTCIRDLRERVAGGGDPTKLHESPTECVDPNVEQDLSTPAEAINSEGLCHERDPSSKSHDADVIQDDMIQEIYDRATAEQNKCNGSSSSSEILITEEQRVRMEANRLKALEKAAAQARLLQST